MFGLFSLYAALCQKLHKYVPVNESLVAHSDTGNLTCAAEKSQGVIVKTYVPLAAKLCSRRDVVHQLRGHSIDEREE